MCPETQEEIHYMSRIPYSSTVGSLMYAMVCTRLDIAHVVGVVSKYMDNLGKEHWKEVHWILRYLRGATSHALCFGGSNIVLQGYVMQILLVIKIAGGAPQSMCLLWV